MLLSLLIACPKKTPEPVVEQPPAFDRSVVPAPLERREFKLPEAQETTLSNGLRVVLVEDHELPLFDVRIVNRAGSWTDPEDREGLAVASLDMVNEGTKSYDAVALSSALRSLGSSLGSRSHLDSSSISCSGLTKNLEPTLDLLAEVVLEPTFPQADWERIQKQSLQSVEASRKDPSDIASRVFDVVLYGDVYDGRFRTVDSINALDVEQMAAWYAEHWTASNSVLLVGGDVTLESVTPLLEERFGTWSLGEPLAAPIIEVAQPTETTIYAVHKADAAQSVIRAGRFVPDRLSEEWNDLYLGNTVFGGMFTARLNMNLREDKGWTYGARSTIWHGYSASGWMAYTSVVADQTAPAIAELLGELKGVETTKPISADEVAYMKSSRINGYPARFEGVGATLDQTSNTWLHGLPEDFAETFIARVDGVTVEGAQGAFSTHVASQPLSIVVVGDLELNREALAGLGLPMVELDVEGAPIEQE